MWASLRLRRTRPCVNDDERLFRAFSKLKRHVNPRLSRGPGLLRDHAFGGDPKLVHFSNFPLDTSAACSAPSLCLAADPASTVNATRAATVASVRLGVMRSSATRTEASTSTSNDRESALNRQVEAKVLHSCYSTIAS